MAAESKYPGAYPQLVTKIITSYVSHHSLSPEQIPELIASVHRTIDNLGKPVEPQAPLTPAVPVRRSVRPDHLVCLECGAKQKTLKRHLATAHGLSVDEYRAKWNLPRDYPMVAPDYAARRSALAKQIGLGRRGAGEAEAPAAAEETPAPEAAAAPRRRGRKTAA
jgi:predicted transcriptional regulator